MSEEHQSPEAPEVETVEQPEGVEAGVEASKADDELAKVRAELEDWKSRAYRAAADLDNLRKRNLKEREDLRRYAIESLVKDMFPVHDNLERAMEAARTATDNGEGLVKGVDMILRQLTKVLSDQGAKAFDPKGQAFDPQFHEAMTQVPRGDVEPNTVVETFQRGWMLHERLVRPAMVVVAKELEVVKDEA